ncbi:MAG: SpoIVB peptidase [Candidatus Limivivens sp.]|nr:SpoIVB peptidase [Candidatus Limivivens sp.]
MWKKQKGRWALVPGLLFCLAVWLGIVFWTRIPDRLQVVRGSDMERVLDFPLDTIFEEEVVTASGQNTSNIPEDQVRIQCSLFGVIPFKSIEVTICEEMEVRPGGEPIGIYMKTSGVLVIGTGEVTGADGMVSEPARNILQSGDYIVEADGKIIAAKEDLIRRVAESEGQEMVLTVSRKDEQIKLKLSPVLTDDQEYKLGIWIRDDTQGIGTLTYVKEDGSFGALGHGISDVDTGTLLSLEGGTLYKTSILSVIKGSQGAPGELSGVIRYQKDQVLGTIDSNTRCGIFGKLNENNMEMELEEPVKVAYKQDVHTGKAMILSSISGQLQEYEIEITKVNPGGRDVNKSMVIQVTDPKLLELTGGIVQGMSGSPIIQDGKLIGAVTHVLVNDPTKGYGVFIENMLLAAE